MLVVPKFNKNKNKKSLINININSETNAYEFQEIIKVYFVPVEVSESRTSDGLMGKISTNQPPTSMAKLISAAIQNIIQ